MDVYEMVASSLAAVIRQSVNPDFRRECYLLLGVTHNREAQNVIYSRLKLPPNAREKMKHLTEKKNDTAQSPETHEQVSNPHTENLDCKQLIQLQETPNVSTPTEDVLKICNDPSENQVIKIEPVDPVESDEESQLDWDTEVS